MRRGRIGSLVVCLLVAWAGPVRADDNAEAKPVLDKAMKALGGEAKVAKLKMANWKGKFTMQEGGQELVVTHEGVWRGLDQYRMEVNVMIMGMNMNGTVVINGDKGWFKMGGMVKEAPEKELPLFKDILFALRSPQLLATLKDKEFKLTPLGEIKIGDRAALGIQIALKDRKDVSLYFDKANGLPVKSEVRVTDPQGKEITMECLYSEYKDFDGLKHPTKVMIKADGKELTLELSEIKPVDKVDDKEFDKP